MAYFQEALKALRPNKEFSTYEDDTIIVWNDKSVVTPSKSEIDNKIIELKLQEEATEKAKILAKSVILSKLGLTAEEAELLLK